MLIDWLLALAPILIILVLMIGFRWGASKAGPVGWLVAVAIAMARFGVGIEMLALAQAKALLLTVDVLLIVWSAFMLYQVSDEAGGIRTLGAALPRLTIDRAMQALLIGWAFASFLQGVGGFGVPVAITAPLLIGIGFSPLPAMIIASIGHAWSVTFGSLASSFQALMASTGVAGELIAAPAGILLGLAGIASGYMVAHAADGKQAIRRLALPILIMGIAMTGTQYALATSGYWNMAGFAGGMAGLLVGVILAQVMNRNAAEARTPAPGRRAVLLALSGYGMLIAVTLLVQMVPPVRQFLGQVTLRVAFPEMVTGLGFSTPAGMGREIPIFRHAGAMLVYASLAAYGISWFTGLYKPGSAGRILSKTVRGVIPSSVGIAALVAMAVVMAHAGMTDVLARGLANSVGALFPLASPWIGALGALMTGSNTNSNVVFAMLQRRTAELLGHSIPLILAAQTAGGAIGSVIAPTKIIVGSTTAGMAGREGSVLRGLARYILLLIAGISLAVWALLHLWPK
ncbi:MAG: L-lactate permease [Anaerolineales bacterium]|jgi:lactate permease